MARWLVTQGDRQFAAQDLNELKQLAADGRVGPGDMIQPPGASDWLYASELPELKGMLKNVSGAHHDDDFSAPRRSLPTGLIAVVLLAVAVGGGYSMYHFASGINEADLALLSEEGLQLTQMLVTADPAQLRGQPQDGAPTVGTAAKDSKVQLLAKRTSWYEIRTESGGQGWVSVDSVVPGYFFADSKTREEYDPIYNPDRYVFVKNSSWMQLPDMRRNNVTVFQFLLQNKSKFEMTDIVLLATIKDKNDRVLEQKEISIEGSIPPYDGLMVGTLVPDKKSDEPVRLLTQTMFDKLAENDPDLALRWTMGIEVQMESENFVEANIDIIQLRAIPKKVN